MGPARKGAMNIEFDTAFDRGYPLYTRANAGEVFPEIVSPLAWSLVGPGAEAGFRRSFVNDFAAIRVPEQPWFMVGRFAGRFHLNMSVIRTVAQRLPGTSAAAADWQYFGDAAGRGMPPHASGTADLLWGLRAAPSALRTIVGLGRRVAAGTADVDAVVARNRAFLATAPTGAALITQLRSLGQAYDGPFGLHVTNRALTSSALSLATSALRRRGISDGAALMMLSHVPGLESVKPSQALREIAESLPRGGPLAELVDSRVSLDELAASPVPGAAELARRLRVFLADFGHRAVNEFDPTYPAWDQHPAAVLALLRTLLGDERPAAAVTKLPERRLDPISAALVANARRAVFRAEITKNDIIRFTHEMRRLVFALGDRLAGRLSREEMTLLTLDELAEVVAGGEPPREVMHRRRAEMDAAAGVEPDVWSYASLALHEQATACRPSEIVGVPGSVGVARGRVRLCVDPLGDFEHGEVLVAKFTDTAWTPMFVASAAVVTDVGGVLSHATIVARELGIPAVVDTKVGTVELRCGDLVEVDGGAGVVRVLERGA
ncbi:MAG TPA: PEP-utilizing enzyme [Pseudonocardia sp.]|jgi:pyruvate,water dikinase|nr:PEP-utilizing enzyme [Pseudonocardia sp.]